MIRFITICTLLLLLTACNSGENTNDAKIAIEPDLQCEYIAGHYSVAGRGGDYTTFSENCTFTDSFCQQQGTLALVDPENGLYELITASGLPKHGCLVDPIDYGTVTALCTIEMNGTSLDLDCPGVVNTEYTLQGLL